MVGLYLKGEINMSMLDWAKREVEIACSQAKEDAKVKDLDYKYSCACYESAFKAYASLIEDGHSGFSISVTKHLLNRLIEGKPLTPIEDKPDIWNEIAVGFRHTTYQCARMGSLFKDVYADGTVKYTDIDRCCSIDTYDPDSTFHSPMVTKIIDEMFPITMPYEPGKCIKVYITNFPILELKRATEINKALTKQQNDDRDIRSILYALMPDGKKVNINRFFKTSKNGWDEIDEDEYKVRYLKWQTGYRHLKGEEESENRY